MIFIIKKFIKFKFPKIFKILKIILNRDDDANIQFKGWGLSINHSPPWKGISKNKTFIGFSECKRILIEKIKKKDFFISQYKNNNSIFEILDGLNYRHYIVYYTSLIAYNNTASKNIVECGVCDGLSIFFVINKYKENQSFNAYLYDSWAEMKEEYLDLKNEKKMLGKYNYLNLETTKKNLKDYDSHLIYNKGYIPDTFKTSKNPDIISWLHIDLNSSIPTSESLKFFYPKLENNGVILFDDYAWNGFESTREVIEKFLEDKTGDFFHLPTGQAYFIKRK